MPRMCVRDAAAHPAFRFTLAPTPARAGAPAAGHRGGAGPCEAGAEEGGVRPPRVVVKHVLIRGRVDDEYAIDMDAAHTLRTTRRRAGLSQRQLAARTGVAQPTIARIERGRAEPRVTTMTKLLAACGWRLEPMRRRGQGVDRTLIRDMLRRSPAERLHIVEEAGRSFGKLFSDAKRIDRKDGQPPAARR